MMMFMNHEGVKKVRQDREAKKKKPDDDTFNKQLESLFGRGVSSFKHTLESTEAVRTKPAEELDEIKIVR